MDFRRCVLTADYHLLHKQYAQALDYHDQVIAHDPTNAKLYMQKYLIAYYLGQEDAEDSRGTTEQLVDILRTAIKAADAVGDRRTQAEASSHLAKLLVARMGSSVEAEAARLATYALSVDAGLEGAKYALAALERVNRTREEARRRAQEEEERKRQEEEVRRRQEDAYRKEEAEFILLARDEANNRALYITRGIVAQKAYHQPGGDIIWEHCTLRKYLNNEYYHSLPKDIRRRIVKVKNQNPRDPFFGAAGDPPTKDKVFLLSIDEANQYFKGESDRVAKMLGKKSPWWLRSLGWEYEARYGAHVTWDGIVSARGYYPVHVIIGVRPAFWLKLSS